MRQKCLTVEITPSAWMPLTDSAASRALCQGSSERYSKLRPLPGSRMRFSSPASCTLNPRLRASRPIAPTGRALEGRVEARAQGDARRHGGRGVALAADVSSVRDAHARVAHPQRRDPQTRHPGRVGRTHRRSDGLRPGPAKAAAQVARGGRDYLGIGDRLRSWAARRARTTVPERGGPSCPRGSVARRTGRSSEVLRLSARWL